MFQSSGYLVGDHDWRLLGLAAVVGFLTSCAAIILLRRARKTSASQRVIWSTAAGAVAGCGIWATQFIAMLGYAHGVAVNYDFSLTLSPLISAMGVSIVSFSVASYRPGTSIAVLGGGLLGIGIALAHHLGTGALDILGPVTWSMGLGLTSIILGVVFGMAALVLAERRFDLPATFIVALILVLAILSHHLTAMSAIQMVIDPTKVVDFAFSPGVLATALAGMASTVLGMSLVAAMLDQRLAVRNGQLKMATNHMSQGLIMFDSAERVVFCNSRYIEMYGLSPQIVKPGCTFLALLRHRAEGGRLTKSPEQYRVERLAVVAGGQLVREILEFADGRTVANITQPTAGGGWVATHEDITEQCRVERVLAEARAEAVAAGNEARAARARLLDAFAVVPQALALFDAQDRHVLWNDRYAESYGAAARELACGVTFEHMLRAGIAESLYPEAEGNENQWLQDQLAGHARPSNSYEQELRGDRWIQVEERRTFEGGNIGIRIDITELKRRELSFRLLFESNPVPMWVYARDTLRFIDVNRAATNHYGYNRQQFLAMSLPDLSPFEDQDDVRAIAGQGINSTGHTWRYLKANLSQVVVAIYTRALRYAGHDAVIVATIDITAQRRVEDELRRTRKFLDTIFADMPVALIVKSARDMRMVLVNKAAEDLYGVARKDLIGKTVLEILPKAQADEVMTRDQMALSSTGSLTHDNLEIETRHNGTRIVAAKRLIIRDESGIPEYVVGLMHDVTEHRRAQEELVDSSRLMQAVFNASPVAIVGTSPLGIVSFWNGAAERLFGFTAQEASGCAVIDLVVPDEERDNFSKFHRRAFSGECFQNLFSRRKRKNGSVIDVQLATACVFADDGTVRAIVVALEDITQRKVLEDQLRQSQKMEAIGQLTGGLSHDLNNLLAVIIGNLDLLREQIGWNPDAGEIIDEALQASLQGADLNQRLLAFARRQPLQPKRVDLNDLVVGMTKLLSRTLGAHIEITLSIADGLWPLLVDPAQMESALTNLAVNARDAMPSGGRLTIGTRNMSIDHDYAEAHADVTAGDFVMLEVTDTGIGMAPDVVAHVFEPFFTTKEKDKGTGLGLSMVFGFVKQSGGHIEVYSEVGMGTTMRLYLPRVGAGIEAKEAPAAAQHQRGHETVLAVEDNDRLRSLLVKQLVDLGYRVLEAGNARDALDILKSKPEVDLLFTDIVLPGGMNGSELARAAVLVRADLKVLYTSGFPKTAFGADGGLPAGAVLLGKPYRKDELARRLRESLAA